MSPPNLQIYQYHITATFGSNSGNRLRSELHLKDDVPNSKMMSLHQTGGNPFLHFKNIPLFFDVGDAKVTLFVHQTGFLSATPHTFLGFSASSTIAKIVYVIGGTDAIDTHYPT